MAKDSVPSDIVTSLSWQESIIASSKRPQEPAHLCFVSAILKVFGRNNGLQPGVTAQTNRPKIITILDFWWGLHVLAFEVETFSDK